MGRRVRALPALLAALTALVAGCELTTVEVTPPEDVVIVEAYLRSDAPAQEVFLYRTLPGRDGTLRVDGADIRIVSEAGESLQLFPTDRSEACVRHSLFGDGDAGSCYLSRSRGEFVRPGATYRLEVELQDGGVLTGTTTVPGDFRILEPARLLCELPSARYTVTWSRAEGAWSYQAVAEFRNLAEGLRQLGLENPPDELTLTGLAVGGADTTIVFPNEFGVFDRFTEERDLILALQEGLPAGSTADILVAAGDRNFVNWVRGGNFNPSGQVRVPSVTGAGTGVFGSLVLHRRTVVAQGSGGGVPSCE